MSTEIKIPSVGESVTSGLLSTWHKKDGEFVSSDDVLFTLETDKVSTEVNAPESGILRITVQEGTEVKVGEVVGSIEAGAPASAAPAKAPMPVDAAPAVVPAVVPAVKEVTLKEEKPLAVASPTLPSVSRASLDESVRTTRRKMTPLRRKIATQLVAAQQTAAILTTFNECDMSTIMRLRKQMQDEFTKKHGVKLGFMSFFVKAIVDALKAVPALNSRIDGDDLVMNHYYDVGVAVGTERGLIVPVLRDCDQKSFADIERDLVGYAQRAREGKIGIDDLQGGVFTISNGGVYGSLLSTPILNPPQSGILGMHSIQERPVAINGQVVIRPMMYLALSYDHRVVDGKEAVTFLIRVKNCIENPARLLLGA